MDKEKTKKFIQDFYKKEFPKKEEIENPRVLISPKLLENLYRQLEEKKLLPDMCNWSSFLHIVLGRYQEEEIKWTLRRAFG